MRYSLRTPNTWWIPHLRSLGSYIHRRSKSQRNPTDLFFFFFFAFCFLGWHLQHMEVPRPGGNSELQLPAIATATATPDLNPLSKARDRTHILTDPSQVHYRWSTTGTLHRLLIYFHLQAQAGEIWTKTRNMLILKNGLMKEVNQGL